MISSLEDVDGRVKPGHDGVVGGKVEASEICRLCLQIWTPHFPTTHVNLL